MIQGARTTLNFLHTGNPTGLKFVVEHGDARCLFDFGREHAPGRALFSLGLEPRLGQEAADLVSVGVAPNLPGVYRGDPWDGRTHLFISHLHLDHTGLIPYLGDDVPLYYPAAMEDLRRAASDSGYLAWRRPPGTAVADRDEIAVEPIRVRFIAVDHDLPGASGFLITTPEATIAFTGDTRWHGLHPEVTASFADEVRGADVLIQEGVSLGSGPVDGALPPLSENELIAKLKRVIAAASGLVIVNLYGMNRERVIGIGNACAAAGRTLLMEPQMGALAGWPGILGSVEEVRQKPRRFCLQLGFGSLPLLIDLKPPPGSVYIHTGGAPMGAFDPAYAVLQAWLARFRLEYRLLTSSGHSRPDDIVRMVERVAPKVVLPVHSAAPEALVLPGIPTFLPQAGVSYSVADLFSPAPSRSAPRAGRRRLGRSRPV